MPALRQASDPMIATLHVCVRHYRDALEKAIEVPISTRGVLYTLAQRMTTKDGSNARPKLSTLAQNCQLSERQVSRHIEAGIEAGYLERTSPGHRGRTAVYRACIPAYRVDPASGRLAQPLLGVAETLSRGSREGLGRVPEPFANPSGGVRKPDISVTKACHI